MSTELDYMDTTPPPEPQYDRTRRSSSSTQRGGKREAGKRLIKKENGNRKWPYFISILILLVIIIILLLSRCSVEKQPDTPQFASSGEIVAGEIDMMTDEEIQAKVNETVEKGMFQVFMNTDITVEKDGNMDVLIQNNKNNHYDCYVIIYDEDGNQLYKSSTIAPGYKLEADKLQGDLKDGKYNCVAQFCVLNDEGQEINRIGVEVHLTKGEK